MADTPASVEQLPAATRERLRPLRSASVPLPDGRSSTERAASGLGAQSVEAMQGRFAGVDPLMPRQYLPWLVTQAVVHPEISQAVSLIVSNANRGHNVVFDADAGQERMVDAAVDALADFSTRIFERGGGVDGLLNHYLGQLAITGAISSEDILAADRSGIERITDVPVQDVEFLWDGECWLPHQVAGADRIELNPQTYGYYAWQTLEGNPYGIPTFSAAVNAILRQASMEQQLDRVLDKMGFLGVFVFQVPHEDYDPSKHGDRDEFEREKDERFEKLKTALTTAHASDAGKLLHVLEEGYEYNLQAGPESRVNGAKDLWELNALELFSGLGMDPALFGRTYSTTETFAAVVMRLMEAQAQAFQRLVARRHEKSLRLEFILRGLQLWPNVVFNPLPQLNPQAHASAEATRWSTTRDKVEQGLLLPDAGAQEVGEDGWADPSRIAGSGDEPGPGDDANTEEVENPEPESLRRRPLRFGYDANRNRYAYQPERIQVRSRGTAQRASYRPFGAERLLERIVTQFLHRYAGRIAPVLDLLQGEVLSDLRHDLRQAPSFADDDEFGRWALDRMNQSFLRHFNRFGEDDLLQQVARQHGEMFEAWRNEDITVWGDDGIPEEATALGQYDLEATRALAQNDTFHMSIYLDDMGSNERKHLERLIAHEFGELGRDVTDPDVMDELMVRLDRSGELLLRRRDHGREGGVGSETDKQAYDRLASRMRRIVLTTVQRSRNTAAIFGMEQAGIEEMEFVAVQDERLSDICEFMHGKVLPVGPAAAYLRRFHAMGPERQEQELRVLKLEELETAWAGGAEELVAGGYGFPPLHPNCRSRLEAVL